MADNRKQLGTDYLLFINTAPSGEPVWKVALCQTTLTITTPKETIDASSKCGNDTLVQPGVETVEMEGQILQKDPTNTAHMSLYDLRQLFRAGQSITFKAGPRGEEEADDGKIIYDFTGKITNMTDTYANKEVGTCSISVTADGEIEESEFVFTT